MADVHRRGFCFKEGKLYLFLPDEVMLIHGWPELQAVRKTGSRNWTPFSPAFRLIGPYRSKKKKKPAHDGQMELALDLPEPARADNSLRARKKRAFDAFRFSFPRHVAARVEKYLSHQWPVLQLFRDQPLALELCRANPALAYALAQPNWFVDPPLEQPLAVVVDWVAGKQRDIMRRLGFPDSEAAVRAMAKVEQESVSPARLLQLRTIMRDPDRAGELAHLPKINAGVIEILADEETAACVRPALLLELAGLAAEKYRAATYARLRNLLDMMACLGEGPAGGGFQSRRQVELKHEEVGRDFRRLDLHGRMAGRFPQPPIPETSSIQALREPNDLVIEGRDQSNCVASYADDVMRHKTYIYRILEPQRATLSLVKNSAGHWVVDELKLSHNRAPSSDTVAAVESWLWPYNPAV